MEESISSAAGKAYPLGPQVLILHVAGAPLLALHCSSACLIAKVRMRCRARYSFPALSVAVHMSAKAGDATSIDATAIRMPNFLILLLPCCSLSNATTLT